MTGTARIIRADSRHLPLADDSVDLVVTSPPYFALRSYTDNGVHYERQIGAEATPDEFVTSLLEVTAECMRVLKPSGSLWVNLGDKYAGGGSGPQGATGQRVGRSSADEPYKASRRVRRHGIRDKSLLGIPWRYALRCIDDLGLILRAEVIWSKPNGLPESVTDRVRRSHEQWFHFTLSPRYFSAVDEIREAHGTTPRYEQRATGRVIPGLPTQSNLGAGGSHLTEANYNALGKLPGSVWAVPTEPLNVPDHLGVDHFAAFPTEWPRRIIAGWSPAGVCTVCGEGRRPIVLAEYIDAGGAGEHERRRDGILAGRESGGGEHLFAATNAGPQAMRLGRANRTTTITGYECACWHSDCRHMTRCADSVCSYPEPPTTPAVVLDPFGGTGTTALVAKALGRHGISVDMSADYCRLAQWRVNDPDSLAKAMRVDKPAKQVDGQGSLLDMFEEDTAMRT